MLADVMRLRIIIAALVFALPLRAEEPVLRSTRELRAISGEEAALKRRVHLQAVVTLVDGGRTAFVQEDGAGSFVHLRSGVPELKAGQRIEVEGVTYAGLYVPGIAPERLRILGEAPRPAPRPVSFEQLASGVFHYEWVEVRGIVRSFREDQNGAGIFALALGDGRLEVLAASVDPAAAALLVDARIRVAGLAAGFINDRRQLVSPHLRVADLADLQIEEAAPADPFAAEVTPVALLRRFRPEGAPGHRVKIRGTVTHHQPGEALFLRDDARGLLVETSDESTVQPGDTVEAIGFAEMGAFSAVLRDATFRRVAPGAAPLPIVATAKAVRTGGFDADLVQVEATLVDVLRSGSGFTLLLRENDLGFEARVAGGEAVALRAGSRLRLTGIARATQPEFSSTGFSARQRSFALWLRSLDDFVVLRAAPFWTAQRLAAVLGLLALVAVAALAWAAALRRRVAAQMAIIRDRTRAEAALEERERIAREFHDTLEQELVGLMLRLDAASARVTEEKPRELLAGARRLVQGVQAGARSLVWNLRQPALEVASLPDAIRQAVADLREGREIAVQTVGEVRRLPAAIEHELLRVAQEAVTNAVKHGAAACIDVELAFPSGEARLRVRDDGRGFDPQIERGKPGHFGLIGMQERVTKLGGSLKITSAPARGTTLEAIVPLPV